MGNPEPIKSELLSYEQRKEINDAEVFVTKLEHDDVKVISRYDSRGSMNIQAAVEEMSGKEIAELRRNINAERKRARLLSNLLDDAEDQIRRSLAE